MVDNGIRCRPIGRWRELDPSVVEMLEEAVEATAGGDRMTLNIALNYSGRCEIVDACRRIVADWAGGKRADIDQETIGEYLYTAGLPDPDLLIRTSGELRLSNFLLWQIAYTEIWVTETLWPDFGRRELYEAILGYQARERRFGGVSPADAGPPERPAAVSDEPRDGALSDATPRHRLRPVDPRRRRRALPAERLVLHPGGAGHRLGFGGVRAHRQGVRPRRAGRAHHRSGAAGGGHPGRLPAGGARCRASRSWSSSPRPCWPRSASAAWCSWPARRSTAPSPPSVRSPSACPTSPCRSPASTGSTLTTRAGHPAARHRLPGRHRGALLRLALRPAQAGAHGVAQQDLGGLGGELPGRGGRDRRLEPVAAGRGRPAPDPGRRPDRRWPPRWATWSSR